MRAGSSGWKWLAGLALLGWLLSLFDEDSARDVTAHARLEQARSSPKSGDGSPSITIVGADPAALEKGLAGQDTAWVVVTGDGVRLRSAAGTHGEVLAAFNRGDILQHIATRGDWANLRHRESGQSGWMHSSYLERSGEPDGLLAPKLDTFGAGKVPGSAISQAAIAKLIIEQSIAGYRGSCPCPYNRDRAGRRCGRRSAYSREGGAAPLCYPGDVTQAQLAQFIDAR